VRQGPKCLASVLPRAQASLIDCERGNAQLGLDPRSIHRRLIAGRD
jgi:hypothetical protein